MIFIRTYNQNVNNLLPKLNKKQVKTVKRRAVIAGIIIVVIMLFFVVFYFLTRPLGHLEVLFNKELPFKVQTVTIDPSGSHIMFGSPEGKLLIMSDRGVETANIEIGYQVLELTLIPESQVVVRTSSGLTCYTYDGKKSWEYKVSEYYPEVLQVLPRSKMGIYMRSLKGEKPLVSILNSQNGKEFKRLKLEIDAFDIQPAFTPDGEYVLFEVQPGMLAKIGLSPELPIQWKTFLDTKNGRFRNLSIKVTNSNLVVCHFNQDSEAPNNTVVEWPLFVIDGEKEPKGTNGTVEMPLFWQTMLTGPIGRIEIDSELDTILVQAGTIYIFNRNGEQIKKEEDGSLYYFASLGNHNRFVSAFFLDAQSATNSSIQFVAKGISQEGVLWRFTETREYILPAISADCETLLLASMEKQRITLLRLSQ